MIDYTKSVESLTGDVWKSVEDYSLPNRVMNYRKIPINDLSIEQLRTLLSQEVSFDLLVDKVLGLLSLDILVEGDMYKGDLFKAFVDNSWFDLNQSQIEHIKALVNKNEGIILDSFGQKFFDRINQKISRD